MKDYKKYRWFFTSGEKLVVGGKNEKQNDELLKSLKEEAIIMHTVFPGSPFCVINSKIEDVTKSDIEETAVFTACFSKEWKSGKKSAEVHIFKTSQISKPKNAKPGLWKVSGKIKKIKVPLELFLIEQKKILRAVPEKTSKNHKLKIVPGNIEKEKLMPEFKKFFGKKFNKEQLMSALPAGGIRIYK